MIDSTANQQALPAVLFSQAILRFLAIRLITNMVPRTFLAVKTTQPEVCTDWLFKITRNTW